MRCSIAAVAAIAFLCLGSTAESATNFTGFWKSDCSNAFGVQIKPQSANIYSISFCGPGGCFAPGTWKPNTPIEGDPSYRVIDAATLEIKNGERWQRYKKCTSETNPALSYSTMQGQTSKPDEPGAGVRFKPYYEGIPDYENKVVFKTDAMNVHSEIRALLKKARASKSLCVRGSVKATVVPPHELQTNICDKSSYAAIKGLIAKIAPSLDPRKWSFRKNDLDGDGEPDVVIEYVDLIGDANVKDPYLSLWHLKYDGAVYRATYAGPFLVGKVHEQTVFGQSSARKMVFVRHSSCTECHPWVYLTVVDFLHSPNGAAFEFTYADDHKSFSHAIEYILPGMGHSADAKVEREPWRPLRKVLI